MAFLQTPADADESDEHVAERVQNGDTESFRILVDRYTPKLTRYARAFVWHTQEREDLLQDIFLRAFVHLKSYTAQRAFSPWIYRIAHNVFANALRSKHRTPVFSVDWDLIFPHPISTEQSDSETLRKERTQQLDECLETLDSKYREVLVLYYFQDQDYQQISEILRIPSSTVGVRLNRGRAALKKAYNALHPDV